MKATEIREFTLSNGYTLTVAADGFQVHDASGRGRESATALHNATADLGEELWSEIEDLLPEELL